MAQLDIAETVVHTPVRVNGEDGRHRKGLRGRPSNPSHPDYRRAPIPPIPTRRSSGPVSSSPTAHVPQGRILFEMACLLGYITKHPSLIDPDAPKASPSSPRNPGRIAFMHQFAIALCCLNPACPSDWICHRNTVRRCNTAPADHDQPAQILILADLAREFQRTRTPDRHS